MIALGFIYNQISSKITCIERPSAYMYIDRILQVPRGILFMLFNLQIKTTCV